MKTKSEFNRAFPHFMRETRIPKNTGIAILNRINFIGVFCREKLRESILLVKDESFETFTKNNLLSVIVYEIMNAVYYACDSSSSRLDSIITDLFYIEPESLSIYPNNEKDSLSECIAVLFNQMDIDDGDAVLRFNSFLGYKPSSKPFDPNQDDDPDVVQEPTAPIVTEAS